MNDVLTFGETMLRFSPIGRDRLAHARTLETWVGGSESNVAATLSALGRSVTWVSRLPDNPLGRRVASELAAVGIDVSSVVWRPADERLGTFYFEPAAPPRSAVTIYDRANSAASRMSPSDLPDVLFETHRHLHLTGITPALSESCAETVSDSVRRAREHGMTVSLDVNYRAKLWSADAAARWLAPIFSQVIIAICSRDDAATLFGIEGSDSDRARALQDRLQIPTVVLTAGAGGAAGIGPDGQAVAVPAFPLEASIERLGSGDAFAAGFIAGHLAGSDLGECLRLGAAAGAFKRTVLGDMLTASSRAEILRLLEDEKAAGWR